ncbi:hypothetical protein [Pseudomonas sp. SDO55104_S430]
MDEKIYDKSSHLLRAETLLKKNDLSSLRYASLEMRYLLEAHVYERLLKEVNELPRSIIEKWEPNKAMKMLSMFDELADMDLKITLTEQDGSNPIEIEYHNLKNSDLSKLYNTLGSFLHLPQPSKSENYKIDKNKLIKICETLRKLTTGNLIIVKTHYDNFECEACKAPILFTYKYASSHDSITCQNEQCKTEHFIEHKDEAFNFGSKIICNCLKCDSDLMIFYSKLKFGEHVKCSTCSTEYRVDPYLNCLETPDGPS